MNENSTWKTDAPTDKQLNFLTKLHEQASDKDIDSSGVIRNPLTKMEASMAIEALMSMLGIEKKEKEYKPKERSSRRRHN